MKFQYLTKVQGRLLQQRHIIRLTGEVNGSMGWQVAESIDWLMTQGAPPVHVLITSSGGSSTIGLDLAYAFRAYPGNKIGVAIGFCHSMATVILQSCDTRVCFPSTCLCPHHVYARGDAFGLHVMENPDELSSRKQSLERDRDLVIDIFVKRTGRTREEIVRMLDEDVTHYGEENVACGLVDVVLNPFAANAEDVGTYLSY